MTVLKHASIASLSWIVRIYDGSKFFTDCFSQKLSYIRRDFEYLVMWDKPGTNSASGRFYNKIRKRFGDELRFVQHSVYGMKTLRSAESLAEMAKRYGLNVLVFRVVENPNVG